MHQRTHKQHRCMQIMFSLFRCSFWFRIRFCRKIIIFPAIWERYWSPSNLFINTREIVLGFVLFGSVPFCMYVSARNFSTIAQWTKAHILFGWTPKHNMKNVKMIWLREWSQIIMSVVVVAKRCIKWFGAAYDDHDSVFSSWLIETKQNGSE